MRITHDYTDEPRARRVRVLDAHLTRRHRRARLERSTWWRGTVGLALLALYAAWAGGLL